MARKKPTATKSAAVKKPATRKPRAKKAAPKKETKATKKQVEDIVEDDIGRTNLYGEIFWEYRAKMAEYEKVLLEHNIADDGLRKEKLDPKYSKLLTLVREQAQLAEDLKSYANLLRGIQVRVASKLNLDIETFLRECTIDHETGVVTIFD